MRRDSGETPWKIKPLKRECLVQKTAPPTPGGISRNGRLARRVLQLEIDDLREQLEAANQDADIARKHASLCNEQLRDLLAALDRTPCTSCNVKLGMVQGEMPRVVQAKDGRWFCADCYDSGAHAGSIPARSTR